MLVMLALTLGSSSLGCGFFIEEILDPGWKDDSLFGLGLCIVVPVFLGSCLGRLGLRLFPVDFTDKQKQCQAGNCEQGNAVRQLCPTRRVSHHLLALLCVSISRLRRGVAEPSTESSCMLTH
jgi:hypothetical protein